MKKNKSILIWVAVIGIAIYLYTKSKKKKETTSSNTNGISYSGGGGGIGSYPTRPVERPIPLGPINIQWNSLGHEHVADIADVDTPVSDSVQQQEMDMAVATMAKFCGN